MKLYAFYVAKSRLHSGDWDQAGGELRGGGGSRQQPFNDKF